MNNRIFLDKTDNHKTSKGEREGRGWQIPTPLSSFPAPSPPPRAGGNTWPSAMPGLYQGPRDATYRLLPVLPCAWSSFATTIPKCIVLTPRPFALPALLPLPFM